MVIDQGTAGLEQSQHHPLAGASANAALDQRSSEDCDREIEADDTDSLRAVLNH